MKLIQFLNYKYFSYFLLFTIAPIWGQEIAYTHYQDEEISAHILEIDPTEYSITLVDCDGVQTPSSIAKKHGAIAAINAGFFRGGENMGNPSGIFQINGVRSSPTDRCRGALGWNGTGDNLLIDRLDSDEIGNLLPFFHPETLEDWNRMDHILGSTPVLVMDYQIPNYFEEKVLFSFAVMDFPRSAVGLKDNGIWIFVMVEGKQSDISSGMSIAKLADFMLSQGCKYALNLDGGYSSTLYYDDLTIYSKRTTGEDEIGDNQDGERPVGNVLLFHKK